MHQAWLAFPLPQQDQLDSSLGVGTGICNIAEVVI